MSTTRETIERWFDDGVRAGKSHMVIVCDAYNHTDDYPHYTSTRSSARRKVNHPGEDHRAMEVYDLRADKAAQLAESRAWNFGDLPPGGKDKASTEIEITGGSAREDLGFGQEPGYTETQRIPDADIRTAREMLAGPPNRIDYAALCDVMQVEPWTAPEPEMEMGYLGEKAGILSTEGAEPYLLSPRDQSKPSPKVVEFTIGRRRLRLVATERGPCLESVDRHDACGDPVWLPFEPHETSFVALLGAALDAVGWTKT